MLHPRNPSGDQTPNPVPELKIHGPVQPAPRRKQVVNHETLTREALIQRILERLRRCDTATLESLALILEQDRNCCQS